MVSPLILYPESSRIWFAGARVFMGMIRHSNKGRPVENVDLGSKPFRSDYVPGTALLIRLDLIDRIGKLDERYSRTTKTSIGASKQSASDTSPTSNLRL